MRFSEYLKARVNPLFNRRPSSALKFRLEGSVFGVMADAIRTLFRNNARGVWFDPSDFGRYMTKGPETIKNGTFDSDTDWVKGAGWTISGGVASNDGSSAVATSLTQVGTFKAGKAYAVSLDLTRSSGTMNLWVKDANGTQLIVSAVATSGAKSYAFTAARTGNLLVEAAASSVISVDNVSIRELPELGTATMFQDISGKTPVTDIGQPIGLILDKSKGVATGPEMAMDAGFDNPAAWTSSGTNPWVVSEGKAQITAAGDGNRWLNGVAQNLTPGKTYKIAFDAVISAGAVRPDMSSVVGLATNATASGRHEWVFPSVTVAGISLLATSAFVGSIDNISVCEVPGNHATQPTAASRPVLMGDGSAYGNERVVNGSFSQTTTGWVVTVAGTSTVTVVDEKARITGDGTNVAILEQAVATEAGKPYRLAFDVSLSTVSVRIGTTQGGSQVLGATGFAVGSNNYDFIASGTTTWIRFDKTSATPTEVDNISAKEITAFSRYYLTFDGVDDWLQTGSIDFTGTDELTMLAGLRKDSGSATSVFLESGAPSAAGGFYIALNSPTGTLSAKASGTGGAAAVERNIEDTAVPSTSVVTVNLDLSQNPAQSIMHLRKNAVASTTFVGGALQTGTFGNFNLNLCRRSDASLPFKGRFYGLVVSGAKYFDWQVGGAERYMANKTGVVV